MNLSENKRRIAEAIGLLLVFAIAGYQIWPTSHLIALLAAVSGTSAVCFAEMPVRWWGASTAGLIVIAGFTYFAAPPILPEETEAHGWLLPANEPTPPNGCTTPSARPIPSDALLFVAGTNGAWTENPSKSLVLHVGDSDLLSIERKNSHLALNAEIFDENGDLVVKIVKNEFHLISGEYSYQERRKDRNKITIHDKKGEEMFYIDYVNPHTVLIRGLFRA